ncbi:hypothetical protein HETIRDRAFT_311119 [Heterobasidion irregulare TC 32-1]|uniref:TAP42-like protein n=1 Tax=Heterobasidion irregulare (strain TC 32-1) TaxID=747525 RepID=W4KM19_HETIT|nr:uncharacterized protein HETIRDRAFT_311119 [Heterobasidion irregulare TC 32-1]ETW86106.1 hypothetical protein HETIRDRAFT_311119 [Heterobasidion irregulare TC 32-1]
MDSLPALFHRALTALSRASNLPTIDDETQDLIASAQKDLRQARSRLSDLSLFSPNEILEDIATRDLIYLFVPFVLAEAESRARALEREERLARLRESEANLLAFVSGLENYEVVPESERELYGKKAPAVADPARRREAKIKQYQKEKEIRSKIDVCRRHATGNSLDDSPTDFDLIASLLPISASPSAEEGEEDDADDVLREVTLLLLRLVYAQARAQLDSLSQEFELLKNAPHTPPGPPEGQSGSRNTDDLDWRLDAMRLSGRNKPLLDAKGKPLQPFTILPSSAADRAQLKSQVFQADHRLPTMTIDEYLDIERERGKFITGGGPASAAQPTSKEQLTMDSEQDGTTFAEEKAEEKRQQDESWARYTDENAKGAGNTMNRG